MDQGSEQTDPRVLRRDPVANVGGFTDLATSPFRIDRDRIAASPFFARLGGGTQVVSAGGGRRPHKPLPPRPKGAPGARALAQRVTPRTDPPPPPQPGGPDPH